MDVVCSIDIGSTYSGYAYSSKKDYNEDMFKIHINDQWMSGHANLHTFKTPTILLLGPDKGLHSFGYEAERKFHQLMEGRNHEQYFYFKRFKVDLKAKVRSTSRLNLRVLPMYIHRNLLNELRKRDEKCESFRASGSKLFAKIKTIFRERNTI